MTIGGRRIAEAIRAAGHSGRPALAPFVTGGFPSRERFREVLERVGRVGDVVEIGVPFGDPMADGVTIQRSSDVALRDGTTLAWILETLAVTSTVAPRVLMSYVNPLFAYGPSLAQDAAAAGVHGLIVPDLPFEEGGDLRASCEAHGVAVIQLVTPVTPSDRLAHLAEASDGFTYAVTTAGTTGGAVRRSDDVTSYLASVRDVSEVPVLAGFGIRTARDLVAIAAHCDGVIVGSAVVEVIERGDDPADFLSGLLTLEEMPS